MQISFMFWASPSLKGLGMLLFTNCNYPIPGLLDLAFYVCGLEVVLDEVEKTCGNCNFCIYGALYQVLKTIGYSGPQLGFVLYKIVPDWKIITSFFFFFIISNLIHPTFKKIFDFGCMLSQAYIVASS